MTIQSFTFGPFGTNCYVVNDEGHALIVDPACSNGYEQQQLHTYIASLQVQRLHIIATHGHLDHLWGARWASEQWHTPVYMAAADRAMAQAMERQYALFGIRATPEPFAIETLEQAPPMMPGMTIIPTPGHTPGSVCFYWEQEQVLLSGDTLFCMGYGRTDLPGGDVGQLIESLTQLMALPANVKVYPGHGQTTTIGAERR